MPTEANSSSQLRVGLNPDPGGVGFLQLEAPEPAHLRQLIPISETRGDPLNFIDPIPVPTGSSQEAKDLEYQSKLVYAVYIGIALLAIGIALLLVVSAVACFRRLKASGAIKKVPAHKEQLPEEKPAADVAGSSMHLPTRADTQPGPTLLETVGAISGNCLDPSSRDDVMEILRGKNLCLRQDIIEGSKPIRILYPLREGLGSTVIRVTDLSLYFDKGAQVNAETLSLPPAIGHEALESLPENRLPAEILEEVGGTRSTRESVRDEQHDTTSEQSSNIDQNFSEADENESTLSTMDSHEADASSTSEQSEETEELEEVSSPKIDLQFIGIDPTHFNCLDDAWSRLKANAHAIKEADPGAECFLCAREMDANDARHQIVETVCCRSACHRKCLEFWFRSNSYCPHQKCTQHVQPASIESK